MVSLETLQAIFEEQRRKEPVYLVDLKGEHDSGPDEIDLNEYIDADVLQEHCKTCKLRRGRRQTRAHFRRL